MLQQFHILNGDCLNAQLPNEISGERIVMREALVDGALDGETLDDFFHVRARFITDDYAACTSEEYMEKTVREIKKIQTIPQGASIYLWFEDDLFCQVNFWFVAHLIHRYANDVSVFLVRPDAESPYNFGAMQQAALLKAYKNPIPLTELNTLADLWKAYRLQQHDALLTISSSLQASYPFIHAAVHAHLARIPSAGNPGLPKTIIREILKEKEEHSLAGICAAFNQRAGIYGFGDLQIKRLLADLNAETRL